MYNLLIGTYNNYFNRIVKKEASDFSYFTVMGNTLIIKNINFNPNDGISTQVIIGKGDFTLPESTTRPIQPDYAILYTTELENPPYSDAKIVSKWFVIEAVRTRSGQYQLTLKRDVLAEHYSNIMNAPCFVEKGCISDKLDPLLFNKEGMSFNQIKKEEIPLKDETGCGWVVGYIPKNSFPAGSPAVDVDVVMGENNADIIVDSLADWEFNNYISKKLTLQDSVLPTTTLKVKHRGEDTSIVQGDPYSVYRYYHNVSFSFNYNGAVNLSQTSGSIKQYNAEPWSLKVESETGSSIGTSGIRSEQALNLVSNIYNNSTYLSYLRSILSDTTGTNYIAQTLYNQILDLNEKIIYDQSTSNYYRISVNTSTESKEVSPTTNNYNSQYESSVINHLNTYMTRTSSRLNWYAANNTTLSGDGDIVISYNNNYIYLDLQQIALPCTVTIDNDRFHLEDSPYDMFCIPYSDTLKLRYGSGNEQVTFTCKKAVALALATAIGEKSGSKQVYDVQLLPYCPARNLIAASPNPSDTLILDSGEYDLVTQNSAPVSAVIWCMTSSFQVPINQSINTILNLKEPFSNISGNLKSNVYYTIQNLDYTPSATTGASINGPLTLVWTDKATGNVIKTQDTQDVSIVLTSVHAPLFDFKDIMYTVRAPGAPFSKIMTISKSEYEASNYYLSVIINGEATIGQYMKDYLKLPTTIRPDDPLIIKTSNECDLYRLCSGNYNGIFEFSVAKSYGVDEFLADCTYKPFTPYIHVTPVLKGLYELPNGTPYRNIDDTRGLICGGDFSLPAVTNAWADYQLQNKNYQAIFDRQIENMDVNNKIAMEQTAWQGDAAIGSSLIGGYAAGAKMGGPLVGAGMAVVGASATGVGAAKDINWLERQQQENKQYAIDMYGYQLGNIKALPNSLAKTSAITYNTRIWPFVEYYTCTDKEKEALKFKLKYNGMTIMKIDNLINYSTSVDFDRVYVKGQLISLEGIEDDSHVADAIYAEVNKGFYILQGE